MDTVLKNLKFLPDLRSMVKNKDLKYFSHTNIPNFQIDEDTISIVMTSSNRSKQVYYTLKTIQNSAYKNIQVILVDDSDHDPVSIDVLKNLSFNIDFVEIKREDKIWKNPCVNYNIGFEYIKGSKILIQNGEVCHLGDVISNFLNINDDEYYVYDVKASANNITNEEFYKLENIQPDVYDKPYFCNVWPWYQHHVMVNRCLHFLTGMTSETFKKIGEFSYDYSFVSGYDDNDFIMKIRRADINVIPISNEKFKVGGIHLWHPRLTCSMAPLANQLLYFKEKYYNTHNTYFEICTTGDEDDSELELNYKKLVSTSV